MILDEFDLKYMFFKNGYTDENYIAFLESCGLSYTGSADYTVNCYYENKLIGTGSTEGNILKYIAIDKSYQGNGIFNTIVTLLIEYLFNKGTETIFVYTKPEKIIVFEDLGFKLIAKTNSVALLERGFKNISTYLESLERFNDNDDIGAIVMNCNPFTKGHLYLIEHASKQSKGLYIFVLSEDRSEFTADERYEMVKQGTKHLSNVIVQKTSSYMVSAATFPTYFQKDNAVVSNQELDLKLFGSIISPRLSIKTRYVGTEPFCKVTRAYNSQMHNVLNAYGIRVCEIERIDIEGMPISASRVRALIDEKRWDEIQALVPLSTLKLIKEKYDVRWSELHA